MGPSLYSQVLPVCGSHQYGASFAMYATATDWPGPLTLELNIVEGPTSDGYYAVTGPDQFIIPLDASWHVYNYGNWTSRAGDTGLQFQFDFMPDSPGPWNSDTSVTIYVDAITLSDWELVCS